MTLAELKTILESITGFQNKVTYNDWSTSQVPSMPFICYLCTSTNNFNADNMVYMVAQDVDVELYTKKKEPQTEALVESAFNNNGIIWNKNETYIDAEKCFLIAYSITI